MSFSSSCFGCAAAAAALCGEYSDPLLPAAAAEPGEYSDPLPAGLYSDPAFVADPGELAPGPLEYAAAVVSWLEHHGRRVVGGSCATRLERSKVQQELLELIPVNVQRAAALLGRLVVDKGLMLLVLRT